VTNDERARREQDLIAYYTNEAQARAERDLPDERIARRAAYLQQLDREARRSVLEIGCGPGRDAQAIASAGFDYTGVDLAPASVGTCRSLGLDVRVASVLALPFEDRVMHYQWAILRTAT
jgi:SAM-dependent methyltransferase